MRPRKSIITQAPTASPCRTQQQAAQAHSRNQSSVVQPKTMAATQPRPQPKAPLVYRPQPVPKVLQAKAAVTAQHAARPTNALPVSAQRTPKDLQKNARTTMPSPPRSVVARSNVQPVTPTVHRTQPPAKAINTARPQLLQQPHRASSAPRPQPLPKVLQAKNNMSAPQNSLQPRAPHAVAANQVKSVPRLTPAALSSTVQRSHAKPRRQAMFTGGTIQRAESKATAKVAGSDLNLWRNNHNRTIGYQQGNKQTIVANKVMGKVKINISEYHLNHFCSGHTIKEFAFDSANIERNEDSTFWDETTTKEDVKNYALQCIKLMENDLDEAVENGGEVVSSRDLTFGSCTIVIKIKIDNIEYKPDGATVKSVEGKLVHFYPRKGDTTFTKGQLYTIKNKLSEEGRNL